MTHDLDAVTQDLYEVARWTIKETFLELKTSKRNIASLQKIVEQRFPHEWQQDKSAALELTIREGIHKLEGALEGGASMRATAYRLFNLSGAPSFPDIKPLSFEGIDGKKYSHILNVLVKEQNIQGASATIGRRTRTLRCALAGVLIRSVEEDSEADDAADLLSIKPVLNDLFVTRAAYETQIREQRDSGTTLMWIHGDAGTGKSRLARAANRDIIAEQDVPLLHASDRNQLEQEIAKMIADRVANSDAINATNIWALFGSLLDSEASPLVVVFDDMPPDGDILNLIQTPKRTLLLFTSVQAPSSQFHGYSINVGELEPLELLEMVTSRLPDATDEERLQLARALGGRPLAIEHSCSYIRETGFTVGDYCEALAEQPAETLEAAGERFGTTLTKIYQLTLQQLNSSLDSLRALDLIIFTSPGLINADVLIEAWVEELDLPSSAPLVAPSSEGVSMDEVDKEYMRSASLWCLTWPGAETLEPTRFPRISSLSRVKLNAALRRLEAFGLVRSDKDLLTVHQLTRAILRALREDQADSIFERLKRTVYDTLKAENWEAGNALSISRIRWAPHLRETVVRATRDPVSLIKGPTDELVRLATLAVMMMRAHRQLGSVLVRDIYDEIALLFTAIDVRLGYMKGEVPGKEVLQKAYWDLRTEIFESLIMARGFDHSVDSYPNKGQAPTPRQAWHANSFRLKHHTEWELSHHYVNTAARKKHADSARKAAMAPISGVRKFSAEVAVALASVYYDQAKWMEAVNELEYAYSSYLKVAANIEHIRGAMDAARRLSRVHLRAGRLDDAEAWLQRAVSEVYVPRCATNFNGKPSPFRLHDVPFDVQFSQANVELELTRAALEWDGSEANLEPEMIAQFINPRLEEAGRALTVLQDIAALRLVPEFKVYVFRLKALGGERDEFLLKSLASEFESNALVYQSDLLKLQMTVFATSGLAVYLTVDEQELASLLTDQPEEAVRYVMQMRDSRSEMVDGIYEMAQRMRGYHHNPYWYARGLCSAVMLGSAAGRNSSWLGKVRNELDQAASAIDRPDWIEKVDGFGYTNLGMWLLGY